MEVYQCELDIETAAEIGLTKGQCPPGVENCEECIFGVYRETNDDW